MSLKLLIILFFVALATADVKFTIVNKCSYTIWPGFQGNPLPSPAGFQLNAGQSRTVTLKDRTSAARIWARTGCTGTDGSTFKCVTGDCGNRVDCQGRGGQVPASLAEFTLATNGMDTYDISYVDGSNIPVIMAPNSGTFKTFDNGIYDCKLAGLCNKDLRNVVSEDMKVRNNGQVVATKSACSATGSDRYCCKNAYSTPQTCKVSSFPAQYYSNLKSNCPMAYIYAYDDNKSTFTCRPASGRVSPDYTVTFCQTK